jgi:hypothetical protein
MLKSLSDFLYSKNYKFAKNYEIFTNMNTVSRGHILATKYKYCSCLAESLRVTSPCESMIQIEN